MQQKQIGTKCPGVRYPAGGGRVLEGLEDPAPSQKPEEPTPAVAEAEPFTLAIVPSSWSASYGPYRPRAGAVVVPEHKAVVQLMRELKRRSGLTDAEVAERMTCSRQSVTVAQNDFRSPTNQRRVSLLWAAKFAQVCGGRIVVEFPSEQ